MFKSTHRGYRPLVIGATCVGLLLCISCNNNKDNKDSYSSSSAGTGKYIDQDLYTDPSGTTWVPLQHAVESLGLRMKDSGSVVQIGYTDPMYQVYPEQARATSLGKTIHLLEVPKRWRGKLYVTPDSLSRLLHTEVKWNQRDHKVEISSPQDDGFNDEIQSQSLRATSTSKDMNDLISYAKTYLGVPYEFGAEPYELSKTFDCSSFTQHVFKKFNISLPRLARDQAKRGTEVKREELQAGDLIYFTVPNRFKDNSIPGHVGIYMGDGKFIHTWGEPGVQISPLDSGYWSDVILFMRRVS